MSRLHRCLVLLCALLIPACLMEDAPDDWTGAAAADQLADQVSGEVTTQATTRVRIMAANITSGNLQSYDPGHGVRIFQGTDPDIVLIQELNYGSNTNADMRELVDTAFGSGYSFFRESGAQIPNGIISRYPILEAGEWNDPFVSNRDFAYARIDIPGPVDLWAVSVHFLTSSSTSRNNQAGELIDNIRQHVPAGDYLVIGGDFNTSSRSESCISTLRQEVVASSPYPVDRNGNGNTNAARLRPYDWVLADDDLDPLETAVVIGNSSFANGTVIDTRVYSPLGEISPALSGDSGSTNMQHMAVIRDFLIPDDGSGGDPGDPGDPGSAAVFLNEIRANEPGSSTSGEFIEVANTGSAAADIGGWTLSDGSGTRHVFPAGTTLGAHSAIVVFGSASGIPGGTPGAVASSTGSLSLANGGDSVRLRDGQGTMIDSVTYSSSLAGADGVSMNRSPDATPGAPFALHTSLSASSSSPGTRVTGASF